MQQNEEILSEIDKIYVTLRKKEMADTCITNIIFLKDLDSFGIKRKTLAKCLNKTESAISQDIRDDAFKMKDIDMMCELGYFPHGNFMMFENGSQHHVSQVRDANEYIPAVHRLYLLISDGLAIYKNIPTLSKVTGVSQWKLRQMNKRVLDDEHGWITPPDVLETVLWREFLAVSSKLESADFWRYINDENGMYPIPEDVRGKYIPARAYQNLKNYVDAELQASNVLSEELSRKYSSVSTELEESEKKIKELNKSLETAKKEKESFRQSLSSKNAMFLNMRNIAQKTNSDMEEQLNLLEYYIQGENVGIILQRMKRIIKTAKEDISK